MESGDFGENGVFGENGRNGDLSPNTRNCKQKFKHDGKGALWKVAILAKMACTNSVSFHQPQIKKIESACWPRS